jgi:hypothetical protein
MEALAVRLRCSEGLITRIGEFLDLCGLTVKIAYARRDTLELHCFSSEDRNMSLSIIEGNDFGAEIAATRTPVAFLASNLSAAICWAIAGIAALTQEPKLMISYGLAGAALTFIAFRTKMSHTEGIRRRIR